MRAVLSQYETNLESPHLLSDKTVDIIQKCITAISHDIERLLNLEIKREYLVSIDRMNAVIREFTMIVNEFVPEQKTDIVLKRLEVSAMKGGNGNRNP